MMRLMPSTNPFGASPSWGTGVRNVFRNDFVKIVNLGIHNKQLYHNFSLFGDILSCKVITDPESNNKSEGYGYVHADTNEAVLASTSKLDGKTSSIVIEVKMFTNNQQPGWTASARKSPTTSN